MQRVEHAGTLEESKRRGDGAPLVSAIVTVASQRLGAPGRRGRDGRYALGFSKAVRVRVR